MHVDPALGFVLLQGCGRDGALAAHQLAQHPWWGHRR
jgi:hypothetical protein